MREKARFVCLNQIAANDQALSRNDSQSGFSPQIGKNPRMLRARMIKAP